MTKNSLALAAMLGATQTVSAQTAREHLLMDFGWLFSLGHAYDTDKDFRHGTRYFSYLAKAGYGDGPAAKDFDDRGWRKLNLPHDWAAELGFDAEASYSHGFKKLGRKFPENSVGWYRKSFFIPESDLGRRISVQFDGVHRDSVVWVNGFYLGRQGNGTVSFCYDITDYLNYGGDNVVAVRADATMEEGWYYEGAGIYRHVWMNKTAPLHVEHDGTFVSAQIEGNSATVTARATLVNESREKQSFEIIQDLVDWEGNSVATSSLKNLSLEAGESNDFACDLQIKQPRLWSLEDPYRYKVITSILAGKGLVDRVETPFGVRSIRFDADQGFFLNGKHVKLKGTNDHQDHAGVGTAIPDALQEYRVRLLKEMGSNAIRCSHNPPTPELLDICDRLGILVIVENRLMGSGPELQDLMKRMILRDRNHPCVFAWSVGNEEWEIESSIKGARIAATSQAFAKRVDPTRPITAAVSGGADDGIASVLEVMGYNYIFQWDTDRHHAKYPKQPSMGTEESTTESTRGIYLDEDRSIAHAAPSDRKKDGLGVEKGWKHYVARPYLSGLFYWTGFDYRGEPVPFPYPAVVSQYGILDLCGFPKDPYYYLKSWWTEQPVLELVPHWNWKGREGQEVEVRAQSNCDEVELFLNGKSLGKKAMEKNSHLSWLVKYEPGLLLAEGYKQGKKIISRQVETTDEAAALVLKVDRDLIKADGEDVSVITVSATDLKGRAVPTAGNEVEFTLEGPGRIIGVGNGDPSSHEADRCVEGVATAEILNLKSLRIDSLDNRAETAADYDDKDWKPAFDGPEDYSMVPEQVHVVVRGEFTLPNFGDRDEIILFSKSIGEVQSLYVNGKRVLNNVTKDTPSQEVVLEHALLHPGKNSFAMLGNPLTKKYKWQHVNTNPGVVRIITPADSWKRRLFSGLAQVIVQADKNAGTLVLKAKSAGLTSAQITVKSQAVTLRPALP